jgi:hypothetical protein
MSDDPELEAFLRRFRPRTPAPLSPRRRRSIRPWWVMAAAAGLSILAWWGRSSPPPEPPLARAVPSRPLPATLGAFRVALRSGTYEAALDDLDGVLLPDPSRQGGALQALADVTRDR